MYRCMAMYEDAANGLSPYALVDDDDKSFVMRQKVVSKNESSIKGLEGQPLQELEFQVALEMMDDPQWDSKANWDWDRYFAYARQNSTFGTYFNLAGHWGLHFICNVTS